MSNLPVYISEVFILTTLLTLILFFRSVAWSKKIIIIVSGWTILQGIIGLSGFYTKTSALPPRFALLIIPPLIATGILFITAKGRSFIDTIDIRILTLIHIVRIPVELVLYLLFINKLVPEVMTFEGRNWDILSGLSAPIIYYFGFVKGTINRKIILLWNFICLLLLVNIIITAVLSAPFPFQKLGFDQPNTAILYFPFIWLPGIIVPIVLFSHLTSIRFALGISRRKIEVCVEKLTS